MAASSKSPETGSAGTGQSTASPEPAKKAGPAPAPPTRRSPVTMTAKQAQAGLRASVQIREIDPWSTLKLSSIISLVLFLVWMIAVGMLYLVLDFMNVWERLNSAFTDMLNEGATGEIISASQIFGWAAAIGFINMILLTALLTLASFIYNLTADLVGGVEVTLADRD
ncbi:DUF3566 domain-containing protein [Lolliginicoccus lacisalsi]|uniref:DUF3566 domain-containing protein n=1 Tax=Lolliginicoccus lacisalsi TaxID=2742202 RepID=UPI002FD0CB4F